MYKHSVTVKNARSSTVALFLFTGTGPASGSVRSRLLL